MADLLSRITEARYVDAYFFYVGVCLLTIVTDIRFSIEFFCYIDYFIFIICNLILFIFQIEQMFSTNAKCFFNLFHVMFLNVIDFLLFIFYDT